MEYFFGGNFFIFGAGSRTGKRMGSCIMAEALDERDLAVYFVIGLKDCNWFYNGIGLMQVDWVVIGIYNGIKNLEVSG